MSTKRDVLDQLSRSEQGLTAAVLKRRLVGPQKLSFNDEVQLRADIDRALLTLKHEHRAWPYRGKRWAVTSRGRRS